MKEGDRIKWARMSGKGKSRKMKVTSGELIKLVKGGEKWALIILDDRFYQQRVPVNELTSQE